MDEDEKTGKMAALQSEIRVLVGEDIAEKYMTLVKQWLDGKIRMDQFDRRGQRMNVPLDVHSRYMLQIGELFDLPFENPKDPMVKRVKRKRKNSDSLSTSNTNLSPTISMTSTEKSDKLTSGSLSKRLLLFAITNGVGNLETQSLASAPTVHQRAQFVDDLLRYASLEKTSHEITESGFLVFNAPINYRIITEVDLCNALQRYPFILPDEHLRNLLIENLSREPANKQKTKKRRKRKHDYANSTPEISTIESSTGPSPFNYQPTNSLLFQSQPTYEADDFFTFDGLNECPNLLSNGTKIESHLVTNSVPEIVQSQPNNPTTSSDQTNDQHMEITHKNGDPDDWLGDLNF
ncbi:hypothetical protein M3Y98_01057500 [Aphelenchoides besseyi]|nr:hypothetical protein M3Y98_01057500 [Aphelenchoides besseyi]